MKKVLLFQMSALVLGVLLLVASAGAEPWKFGIMSDTQWKADLDGENPNTVAVGIIKQLNQQFMDEGVEFVIQVGDLTDKGDNAGAMETRAAAAQELCDAGIGFFPLRGNHESSQAAALLFQEFYPQAVGNGSCIHGASNFSSPFETLQGLSYAFDFNNARFLLLDQFTRADGSNYNGTSNDNAIDQQPWIDAQLAGKGEENHGFAFSHKELMGANHSDILFGSNPAANPDAQNAFFHSLQEHGVRYEFGGHDHNHMRSLVASPDGQATLQNIITSSNSYKFYVPKIPSNDERYNLPAFGVLRETPIVQELFTIGYYIVTVDGPRVTVEHYASDNGCGGTLGNGQDCDLQVTPELTFFKRDTFGYSLNGKEFPIAQGESYSTVEDRFEGSKAQILAGSNGSTATIFDGRPTVKDINTGWTRKADTHHRGCKARGRDDLASHILTLWGMADLGSEQTDTYVLSMNYHDRPSHLGHGAFGIAALDEDGEWVNAVDLNFGGKKNFVVGPWKARYGIGTYGVDPKSGTAWAVLNYNGDFAVSRDLEKVPGHRKTHGPRYGKSHFNGGKW